MCVRLVFSSPTVHATTFTQQCRYFQQLEIQHISDSKGRDVKDALDEMIKDLRPDDFVRGFGDMPVRPSTSSSVVRTHAHDDAAMKLSSCRHAADQPVALATKVRDRSSGIQSPAFVAHQGVDVFDVDSELQAVSRKKHGVATASSLLPRVNPTWQTIHQGVRVRFFGDAVRVVHTVMGDSVQTNCNAVRRLWDDFLGLQGKALCAFHHAT